MEGRTGSRLPREELHIVKSASGRRGILRQDGVQGGAVHTKSSSKASEAPRLVVKTVVSKPESAGVT